MISLAHQCLLSKSAESRGFMTCFGMCRRTRDSMPQAWDRRGKPSRSQAPLLAGARSVQHQCSRCMHVERETKANRKGSYLCADRS